MSIVQAVLLGILGGFGIWDSRVFGLWMIERPLILGPLVGIILGDLQTGIIVGASLELVMMGVVELALLRLRIQYQEVFLQRHLLLHPDLI
mgnify:CR=1 FL=1